MPVKSKINFKYIQTKKKSVIVCVLGMLMWKMEGMKLINSAELENQDTDSCQEIQFGRYTLNSKVTVI